MCMNLTLNVQPQWKQRREDSQVLRQIYIFQKKTVEVSSNHHYPLNKFQVSKETVVLRRWQRSKQKFGFIKRVDKGEITTVVISPLSTRLIKPNFCYHYPLSIIMIIMNIIDTVNFSHFSGYDS